MSSHKRNLSGLERHPGRRPRLDHAVVQVRSTAGVKASLEGIATAHGCTYAGDPSISALLNRVAGGEAVVISAPPGGLALPSGAVAPEEEPKSPVVLGLRLATGAKARLEEIALSYGLTFGKRGSVSALLESVASGALVILAVPQGEARTK